MNVIYFCAVKRALIHVNLAAMMKRFSSGHAAKSIFPALALTLLTIALFTGATSAKDGDTIAAGRALSERLCGRCHATGAADNSPLAKAPPFRTFKSKWPLSHLEEALAEGIVTGHADMPLFSFSTAEIGQLLSHIDSLPVQSD